MGYHSRRPNLAKGRRSYLAQWFVILDEKPMNRKEHPETALAVSVECYAGHRGEQEPRCIRFDGRTVRVIEVLDCWLAPDHRYFKIAGDDGATYILRHDPIAEAWEVILYQRAASRD